jgi:hypothetical protein
MAVMERLPGLLCGDGLPGRQLDECVLIFVARNYEEGHDLGVVEIPVGLRLADRVVVRVRHGDVRRAHGIVQLGARNTIELVEVARELRAARELEYDARAPDLVIAAAERQLVLLASPWRARVERVCVLDARDLGYGHGATRHNHVIGAGVRWTHREGTKAG